MMDSAKRCFHFIAEIIGKELFLKLCTEYVETNMKKTDCICGMPKIAVTYYHPSINYEWNMGLDDIGYMH
jgi:hypothetical protein